MASLVALVVDDDEVVLALTERILRQAGYTVLSAGTVADAHRLLRLSPLPVGVVVTDIQMPDESGFHLADELSLLWPDVPVLFMSGGYYVGDPDLEARLLSKKRAFLEKPFTEATLLGKLAELRGPGARSAGA